MFFKVAQKEMIYFGYFSSKICRQEQLNTAKSGHTGLTSSFF